MCTVTIVPVASGGFILACNRDELRRRPPAEPPAIWEQGGRRFALPIDPPSHGTWIAANDAGLVATLLNVNLAGQGHAFHSRASRGTIIPSLMRFETVRQVTEHVALNVDEYAPFRLVLADRNDVHEYRSDGQRIEFRAVGRINDGPHLFTSSGLGDDRVTQPRRELFERMFTMPERYDDDQAAFHRHAWPMHPELSVCMNRTDAATVSFTRVTVTAGGVLMQYMPGLACVEGDLHVVELDRAVQRAR